jgi:hypothetical protein
VRASLSHLRVDLARVDQLSQSLVDLMDKVSLRFFFEEDCSHEKMESDYQDQMGSLFSLRRRDDEDL